MLYTLKNIFEYKESDLDNFLPANTLTLAEKRYYTIKILIQNNLFSNSEIINQPSLLKFLQNNNYLAATVVNVKVEFIRPKYQNLQEWCEDSDNVYIARKGIVFVNSAQGKERYPKQDSIWANPFKISATNVRETVIEQYRKYIFDKLEREPALRLELAKLIGKNLGCWCKPGPCHGDILLEAINKYY